MGNRAVITTKGRGKKRVGIYLHWNGGRDSVEAFLAYCKIRKFRGPASDCYGMARLVQVIANFFGGDLSIGVDLISNLDCDNGDNGVYVIDDNWKIIKREYFDWIEQHEHDLLDMLKQINQKQPEADRVPESELVRFINMRGEI